MLVDFDHDIASMAVSMHEVMLHQHRKECLCADIGDNSVEIMNIVFIETYGVALDELLDQHFVGRLRVGTGKSHIFVNCHRIERIDILLLLQEGELGGKDVLQGDFSHRYFEEF